MLIQGRIQPPDTCLAYSAIEIAKTRKIATLTQLMRKPSSTSTQRGYIECIARGGHLRLGEHPQLGRMARALRGMCGSRLRLTCGRCFRFGWPSGREGEGAASPLGRRGALLMLVVALDSSTWSAAGVASRGEALWAGAALLAGAAYGAVYAWKGSRWMEGLLGRAAWPARRR